MSRLTDAFTNKMSSSWPPRRPLYLSLSISLLMVCVGYLIVFAVLPTSSVRDAGEGTVGRTQEKSSGGGFQGPWKESQKAALRAQAEAPVEVVAEGEETGKYVARIEVSKADFEWHQLMLEIEDAEQRLRELEVRKRKLAVERINRALSK